MMFPKTVALVAVLAAGISVTACSSDTEEGQGRTDSFDGLVATSSPDGDGRARGTLQDPRDGKILVDMTLNAATGHYRHAQDGKKENARFGQLTESISRERQLAWMNEYMYTLHKSTVSGMRGYSCSKTCSVRCGGKEFDGDKSTDASCEICEGSCPEAEAAF